MAVPVRRQTEQQRAFCHNFEKRVQKICSFFACLYFCVFEPCCQKLPPPLSHQLRFMIRHAWQNWIFTLQSKPLAYEKHLRKMENFFLVFCPPQYGGYIFGFS